MARRNKADWDALLADYAKAFQETNIKAQDWYDSVINDGSWGSAKRYITAKKAKEYLGGDTTKSQPNKSANNRKTSANNAKSSKPSANNRKSQTANESTSNHKSLKNKKNSAKSKSNNTNKDLAKGESISANSQSESATAKQPHGALSQEISSGGDSEEEIRPFIDGEMCGARTRFGGRCRKEMGWGTDHFGAGRCRIHGGHQSGAPVRNNNSTVHGIYSEYLDDDELEFFNSQSAVEMDLSPEIARVRVELKRCYERAAAQRDIIGGAKGYFDWSKSDLVRELNETEEAGGIPEDDEKPADGFSGLDFNIDFETPKKTTANASVSKFVVRDYGAIADKLMGRLLGLMRQQTQLANFVPRDEALEMLDFYISEYEANAITAKQVALSLSRFGIKVPSVIEISLRAEIEVEGAGDAEGLSDAELDAMVDKERAEAEAGFDANMEGRDELIAQMMAGENIDLEVLEDGD